MPEAESGEFQHSLATLLMGAVSFGEQDGHKPYAVVVASHIRREEAGGRFTLMGNISEEEFLALQGDINDSAGIKTSEQVMREFGFTRLLVAAAENPTAILEMGVSEVQLRSLLSDLAKYEARQLRGQRRRGRRPAEGTDSRILWDYDTSRLGRLDSFAERIVARPGMGPADPNPRRRR